MDETITLLLMRHSHAAAADFLDTERYGFALQAPGCDADAATLWDKTRYGTYKLLYGEYPPKAVINYIWANRLPKDAAIDNAFTDRAKMIAVRSGPDEYSIGTTTSSLPTAECQTILFDVDVPLVTKNT